jgi:hypothetical protein
MASETLIKLAVKLGKQLGANTSKFLGTKSNITFMGSGPKDGMLFQRSIDPESFATIGIEKILPDIESSLGYATGGKLNDIQMNKLIDNLTTMTETLNPTNVSKGNFGIDALRAKSGMVERQVTDVASSERPINRSGELTSIADEPGQSGMSYAIKNPASIPESVDIQKQLADRARVKKEAVEKYGIKPERFDEIMDSQFDESPAFPSFNTAENIDTSSPLMSKLENRIGGMRDQTEAATGIMASVPRGDLPGKTAAAREFLVNTLKVGDDYPTTKLDDIISAEDFKYIMEGGGGAEGDPLVLVQKYFGPRIAEMIPTGGTTEEIAIFTKKILNNVEDAKGLKPNEEGFDTMTAKIVEDFADGGRAGYARGGAAQDMGNAKNQAASANAGGGATGDFSNETQNRNHNIAMGNNNPPSVTSGGGGITNVVTKNPGFMDWVTSPYKSLQKYAGVYKDPEEDEAVNSEVKNVAYPTGGSFLDPRLEEKKKADIFKEYKADGGIARLGFKFGGSSKFLKKINSKMIKKAADDIFPTDDYKYDAELVVDALVENNPKIFKNMLAGDLDDALRSELYGLAVSETGNRAAMKIRSGRMERPLFDENGNLNKDAVLADATKFSGLDGRKDAVKRGIVNENVPEFKRQSMKLVDGETSKGEKFKTFETTTAPRMFTLNVDRAVSELNIPREEAIRIASLPSDQQKVALQIYLDKNMAQKLELMKYSPKKFDAAKGGRAGYSKGGLAKILEL